MTEQLDNFYIIGISTKSTNKDGQSIKDMGNLWSKFYSEGIPNKVPMKETEYIYSIFMDYESDYTGNYTALIGFKVPSLDNVPNGLIGKEIRGGTYRKFIAKGKMPDAIVSEWKEIWKKDGELNRSYTNDFEVYTEKANQGGKSEVEIYLGIKQP